MASRDRATLRRRLILGDEARDKSPELDVSSSSSDSDTDSESSTESPDEGKKDRKDRKKQRGKGNKTRSDGKQVLDLTALATVLAAASSAPSKSKTPAPPVLDITEDTQPPPIPVPAPAQPADANAIAQSVVQLLQQATDKGKAKKEKTKSKTGTKVAFKRVDQVYDRKIHNFKLKETVQDDAEQDQWDQYVFTVRRTFDVSHRLSGTFVDIKSKYLKECLKDVMGDAKGINLVSEKPALDPKMLFLYLEDIRDLYDHLKAESKTLDDKKEKKHAKIASQHLKLLIGYLDQDFSEAKKA